MITHRRLAKSRTKLHIIPLYNTILSRWIRFLVEVSVSNSQKLIEWIYKQVEGYSRPEKHCEPIQHN